jgi:hypothetical protein
MLAWFVNIYNSQNLLTPEPILLLFIISVLATIWAIVTLFTYHRSKANSTFVALIDIGFVASLIAASYLLRYIGNDNCASLNYNDTSYTASLGIFIVTYTGITVDLDKPCSMLKASWVFAIMNTIFFAITALLALSVRNTQTKETYVRETHYSRHGHRRSGSHRSHRSSRSGRRDAYV